MPGNNNRFPKSDRLHLRKDIDLIFTKGKQLRQYPINVAYSFSPFDKSPVKMAVSVPKKLVKLAVNRNRIKRQIREIHRLNIHHAANYFADKNVTLKLMYVFTGKEAPAFKQLETKIILILQRLVKDHEVGAV